MDERALATRTVEAKRKKPISKIKKNDHFPSIGSPVDRILFLQRTVGNQAVQRLMKSGALQAKLMIGAPGDMYEREADRVAEQVMRKPYQGDFKKSSIREHDQRISIYPKCSKCEEELHKQPLEEDEEELQAKTFSDKTHELNQVLEADINGLQSGGHILPEPVRAFFEPRFREDFSRVRIHTDVKAAGAAKAINARAFTIGQDMVFGAEEFETSTDAGRRLIAHELTHVLQQQHVQRLQREETSDKTAPEKKDEKIDCYIFIYDIGDPELSPIWKASAEAFAKSRQGLAVESGADSTETIQKVNAEYNNSNIYRCIKSIEFFGHGSPGAAMDGKFSAKDFETQEVLRTVTKDNKEVTEKSHVLKNQTLQEQFTNLKGLLCSESYLHFRTCETFKGTTGEEFGKKVSSFFGTYAVGHTEIIDTLLPGKMIFDPPGTATTKIPTSLIPEKTELSKLPFRYFDITIDVSQAKIPIFPEIKPLIYVTAEVLSGSDPDTYELSMTFSKQEPLGALQEFFHISQVFNEFVKALSGGSISPTAKAIKKEGESIIIPIDREIIESFNERNKLMAFSIPTQKYGIVKIEIRGSGTPPSFIKIGGLQTGADLGLSWSSTNLSLLARPYLQIPFMNWRNLIKLSGDIGIYGGRETLMGEARLNLSGNLLDKIYANLSLFGGGGLYGGELSYLVGAGLGGGIQKSGFSIGPSIDIAKTIAPGPTVNLFLRMSWTF